MQQGELVLWPCLEAGRHVDSTCLHRSHLSTCIVYCSSSEDADLQLAIQLSQSMMPGGPDVTGHRRTSDGYDDQSHVTSEEDAVQQAIALSLGGITGAGEGGNKAEEDMMSKAIAASLEGKQKIQRI